jgi:hypothetical protein
MNECEECEGTGKICECVDKIKNGVSVCFGCYRKDKPFETWFEQCHRRILTCQKCCGRGKYEAKREG